MQSGPSLACSRTPSAFLTCSHSFSTLAFAAPLSTCILLLTPASQSLLAHSCPQKPSGTQLHEPACPLQPLEHILGCGFTSFLKLSLEKSFICWWRLVLLWVVLGSSFLSFCQLEWLSGAKIDKSTCFQTLIANSLHPWQEKIVPKKELDFGALCLG